MGVLQASKVKRTSERLHPQMTLKVILIIIVIFTNFSTLMMNVVSLVGNVTTLVLDVPNTNKESTKKDVIIVVDFDIVGLVAISQKLAICEQFYSIKIIIAMKTQWCSIKSFLTFYMTFYMLSISCMLPLKSSNDSPKIIIFKMTHACKTINHHR